MDREVAVYAPHLILLSTFLVLCNKELYLSEPFQILVQYHLFTLHHYQVQEH